MMSQQTKRATQLADMVWRFEHGACITPRDVCALYGVSIRTAQRLLFDIDAELLPLEQVIKRPMTYRRMDLGR